MVDSGAARRPRSRGGKTRTNYQPSTTGEEVLLKNAHTIQFFSNSAFVKFNI